MCRDKEREMGNECMNERERYREGGRKRERRGRKEEGGEREGKERETRRQLIRH